MRSKRTWLGVAVAAGAVFITAVAMTAIGQATHTPANKVWVSASTLEVMHAQTGPATNQEVITERPNEVILAVGKARYSNPTDLRISASSECALWTNTATTGDDDAESKARVEMWVEIDGNVVPVSGTEGAPAPNPLPTGGTVDPEDQAAQAGRVVICNRATRMKTENIEGTAGMTCSTAVVGSCDDDTEDDILIRSYNRTRTANGFNWAAMDVGRNYDEGTKGIVTVELHARLASSLRDEDSSDNCGDPAGPGSDPANPACGSDTSGPDHTDDQIVSDDSPLAAAAVGKRTLFVEPVKMSNDASF
jgi:hypothetical protein